MKNFLKNKMLKRTLLGLSLAIMMVGGVLVYQAMANATITPASGGSAVSIDTTTYAGGSSAWTELTGMKITEGAAADIVPGQYVLTLPDGWEFDVTQSITINTIGHGLTLSDYSVLPSSTSTLSFFVNQASASSDSLTFATAIKVHPTGNATSTGNITMTTGTIEGVAENYNFGTLTTVAGTATKLGFTTQPTDTVYGDAISNVVVESQDKFGNFSVVGLAASNIITIAKTVGTGTLSGNATMDIGTSTGNGVVTYTDLKIGSTGAIGADKKLTATSGSGLAVIESTAFAITPRLITITAATNTKDYDATSTAAVLPTITVGTLADGDTATTTETYYDETATTSKILTPAVTSIKDNNGAGADMTGNYGITLASVSTGVITPLALTVTGITASNKTYDGLTTATISTTSATFAGIVAGDTVATSTDGAIGTFVSKNVATGITVNIAGAIVTGADAANYTVTPPITTANITQETLTVTAPVVIKEYDGTTAATGTSEYVGLATGDVPDTTLTFDTKNFGSGNKTVTPATTIKDGSNVNMTANYIIIDTPNAASTISKRLITITAATNNKTYDATSTAAAIPTITSGTLAAGDAATTTEAYDTKNASTSDKVLVPTVTSIKDAGGAGADMSSNYTITLVNDTTGIITPLQLTINPVVSIIEDKVYDQTTTATVTPDTLIGVIPNDIVGVTAVANYASPTVGTGKVITVVYSLTGADSANYTKPGDAYTSAEGSITPIQLTITDPTVTKSKTYDATTTATTVATGTLSGVLSGDDVTANAVSSYATKTVEATKTITTVYSLTGTKAENYIAPTNFSTVDGAIVAKGLTVTGASVTSREYDGDTDATITGATLSGAVEGDDVTLGSSTIGVFADKNVANGISATTTPMTITGADAGNYSLTQPTLTGNITKASPGIIWNHPADIAAGTALSGTQLNATATGVVAGALAGTFVYDPAVSYATNTVGVLTLDTTFTPTDTTNYYNQTASAEVNIVPAAIAKLTISADPSNLVASENSTITVTGYDQYDNVVTNNSSAVVSLSTDNGGSLASTLLTLTSGVKTTTLSKNSAGVVNVNAISGILTPVTTPVTFTAVSTDTQAPTISAISTSTTQTTAAITFTANENGQGKVAYSVSGVTPIATNYVSLASGTPKIINLANLVCNTTYNYTIYAKDGSNNEATSADDTFTTSACTATVIPTITLIGTTTVSAYTATEAAARFGSGLQFTTANATSTTVNGTVVTSTTTLTAVSSSSAQTLGAHTYNVIVTSTTGHTANMTISYQVNADGATDAAIPTIEDFGPNNNDTGVALNRYVFILFDEVMDRNTCLNANVHLWKTSGTSTEVAIDNVECSAPFILNGVEKTAMYITPTSNLSASTTYSLVIDNTVTAQYGTHFAGLSVGTYSFTTEPDAGLTADVVGLTHAGVTNGTWGNNGSYGDEDAGAYEWIFAVTLPSSEAFLSLQFADWSNGLGVASTTMRYWSEEIDHAALGGRDVPVSITAASTYPAGVEITGDNSSDAGIQTNVHVQLQIPGATPAGSHSTTFKVQSDTQ